MTVFTPPNKQGNVVVPTEPPKRQSLVLSALGISIASALTVILGFALQVVLAAFFGAARETDAYLAAWAIPSILTIVLFGSFSITFIPVFVEYQVRGHAEDAWTVVIGFLYLCVGLLVALCTGLAIFAEPIIRITTPGFEPGSDIFILTVYLFRLLLPSIVFSGVAGILRSIYFAQKRFVLASWAPVINGIIMVGGTVVLSHRMGVSSVAVSTLIGSIIQFTLLVGVLIRSRYRASWRAVQHPGVRRVLALMLPWMLSAAFSKSNTLIDRFFASQMDVGSISSLDYAYRLMIAISQVLTQGISMVLFPLMAEYVAAANTSELRRISAQGVRLTVLLAIPATIAIVTLNQPLVRIFFERGHFDAAATTRTADALVAYMGAFFSAAVGSVLTFVFYASQDTVTVAVVGGIGFGINLVAAFILTPLLGVIGPALAFSLASMFNLIVLTFLLRQRLHGFEIDVLFKTIFRLLPASVLAWLIWSQGISWLGGTPTRDLVGTVSVVVILLFGGVAFVGVGLLMGVDEIHALAMYVRRRLITRRAAHPGNGDI